MSTNQVHTKSAWTLEDVDMPNVSNDVPGNRPSLIKRLREHGENSNVHGISHILTRRTKFRSAIWIVAFLGLSAFAAYQLMNIYFMYNAYPTKTNVKVEFKPLPMPYISVCNMNPIRLSKVDLVTDPLLKDILRDNDISDHISEYRMNYQAVLNDDDSYYNYYYEDTDDIAHNITLSNNYITRQLYLTSMQSLIWDERRYLGHQIEDMIVVCEFRGSDCKLSVVPFLSAYYGNCYTVDMSSYIAGTAGPSSGVTMVINLETFETLDITEGYGMVLMLHEQGEILFPENDGIVLSGGSETHIRMKLTHINRKGPPYGECKNITSTGNAYTFSECLQGCLNSIYRVECGCDLTTTNVYNYTIDELIRYCRGRADDLKCSMQWYKTVLKDTNTYCDCPPPCRENVYTTSVSSRTWPTELYRTTLLADVCDHNLNCTLYDAFISDNQLNANFLKLQLYFEDLNHEIIEEVPVYDATQLLSDIGGSVGLCLGVSLLCIVELIEAMLEICEAVYRKVRRRRYSG